MKRYLFLLILLQIPLLGFAQIDRSRRTLQMNQGPPIDQRNQNPQEGQESDGNNGEFDKAPIEDYKIISIANDTTHVDTSLTIEDDFRFNYLRTDNFGLLPFSNVGQTYNKLTYELEGFRKNLLPQFGARARHYNFWEVEDISYFHVPTPMTEVYFKTVFEQGQTLETLFTVNTTPNLNLFIGYMGLRSLGKYQHILASTGNFRVGGSYDSPNGRYRLRTHFVSQDLLNQENGGLQPLALEQYLSGDEEYQDRSRLETNFSDAESTLFGKRFYLDHTYDLLVSQDSLASRKLTLGHVLDFSDKKYIYTQNNASETLGPSFETVNLQDEVKLENIYNELSLSYHDRLLGDFRFRGAMTSYNYGYNSVLDLGEDRIQNRLLGENFSVGGGYTKSLGGFELTADLMLGVVGEFTGHSFDASLGYEFSGRDWVRVSLNRNDHAPNFNYLLYQSDYINYNWQNDFQNVKTNTLGVEAHFPKLLSVEADVNTFSDYAYFGLDSEGLVNPFQHDGSIQYFRIKGEREFRLGKFGLHNTLLYQEVLDGSEVFHAPSFITRNTLYFQDHWFQRALFLQTGFTLNYFTDYYLNGYDPVLAEFYVQQHTKFEGFPTLDFFFNGKIRQARIYFKLEHLNSLLMGNDNFSAPLYPYRDFGIRFGLVWNFFM